jgi:hypothetical protein
MEPKRSEQRSEFWRSRRLAGMLLASSLLAVSATTVTRADNPPAPDFYWPYGIARASGANLDPTTQTVIAFVRGKSCGDVQTKVALAGPNVPTSDVGKTVYVVDIAANGGSAGERPGCGQSGDPVLFYLPGMHRTALQQPTFHQGNERVDLDFDNRLPYQLRAPQVASDRTN